jgi:hypothetical protein
MWSPSLINLLIPPKWSNPLISVSAGLFPLTNATFVLVVSQFSDIFSNLNFKYNILLKLYNLINFNWNIEKK